MPQSTLWTFFKQLLFPLHCSANATTRQLQTIRALFDVIFSAIELSEMWNGSLKRDRNCRGAARLIMWCNVLLAGRPFSCEIYPKFWTYTFNFCHLNTVKIINTNTHVYCTQKFKIKETQSLYPLTWKPSRHTNTRLTSRWLVKNRSCTTAPHLYRVWWCGCGGVHTVR